MNEAIRKINDYEKEGYKLDFIDSEEYDFEDEDTHEKGNRIIFKISMVRSIK